MRNGTKHVTDDANSYVANATKYTRGDTQYVIQKSRWYKIRNRRYELIRNSNHTKYTTGDT